MENQSYILGIKVFHLTRILPFRVQRLGNGDLLLFCFIYNYYRSYDTKLLLLLIFKHIYFKFMNWTNRYGLTL